MEPIFVAFVKDKSFDDGATLTGLPPPPPQPDINIIIAADDIIVDIPLIMV
ncbi:MAG: hypothetical protein WCX65_03910 [bacterium]